MVDLGTVGCVGGIERLSRLAMSGKKAEGKKFISDGVDPTSR